MNQTLGAFTIRVLVAIGLGAFAFLLWRVIDVVVLTFGGVVLAVLLRTFTDAVVRWTGLRDSFALTLVVLVLLLLAALLVLLMQARLATQLQQLTRTLPAALEQARDLLNRSPAGQTLVNVMHSMATSSGSSAMLARFAGGAFNALTNMILIPFIGIFLAANPSLYARGLIRLAPPAAREDVSRALDAAARALTHWLLGVLASMACIAVATGLGLWAVGVPLALTLALVAGALEFIPFIGPILSAVPAVLVALTVGPLKALEVVALYIAIQQLEGYLLVPVLQKRAVALPPALAIIAVVVFGLVFGLLGVVFATPLMVAAMVLVQELYVKPLDEAEH